jgi:probable phosphoglycerate mutase
MNQHLYFLRHGDVQRIPSFNAEKDYPDYPLSDLGKQQADLLGQRLQRMPVSKIYCSDLLRAKQTTGIINEFLQLDISENPALREIHMGELHHKSWEAVEQKHPGIYAQWRKHDRDLPYPNGECGADVNNRVMPVVREILKNQEDHVAIVCHGGLIMILFSFFLGLPLEKRFHMRIDNCSISTVEYHVEEDVFVVTSLNDTAHLLKE